MVVPDSPPPKWSRRPPGSAVKRPTKWRLLLAVLIVFALIFVAGRLFTRSTPSPPIAGPPKLPITAAAKAEVRLVSIFYPLADGSGLSGVIQKRNPCPDERACLRDLLLALQENPGIGLIPTLPEQSEIKSVWIDGATATINFSRETIQHLPGGVQSERLILAALVDTLAVNFPRVQQLALQIDGVPAETLKGHVDLTVPYGTDFSLVRRPLLPSSPVKSGSFSERSL